MNYTDFEHQGRLECPKCEKRSLIRQRINKYHCLWCNFRRDISEADMGEFSLLAQFVSIFIAIVLVLSVAFEQVPEPNPTVEKQSTPLLT